DADLQDPPEVIPELLEKFAQGFEIVLGARNRRATDSFFKRATAHLFYQLMRLMGANVVPDHADFRLISKQVLRELKKFPESNRFLRGLIPSLGFKQTVVYYARARRIAGQTKYPLSKMISFALEGITSFTYLPLRLASIIGSCLAVGSLILASWAVLTKLLGKSIPGWASTVLPMYFLGGVQLLFLGIIGEYVGKIYIETKRRPFFIVKEESFEQSDR
ncbi:MAG: glycosyltransferase, partial [Candidatus Margulisbacteria bacterium]|nr:glycosyltransferase [Candidatus Margulisiibacteriota bacterium]